MTVLHCVLRGFLPATSVWAQVQAPGVGPEGSRSVHERARAVAREALAAVEARDTAAARLRWEDALRADAADPMPALGLAALERFTYQPEASERRYRGFLSDDPDLGDPVRLHAALGLGLTLASAFRASEADAWLTRVADAAETAGAAEVEAEALITLASLRVRSRGTAAAVEVLDRADARIPEGDTLLRAHAMCQRALVLVRGGSEPALTLAAEGERLARAAGARRIEAACVTARAQDFERRGLTTRAFAELNRVRDLQRESGHYSGLSATLQWYGYMLGSYGRFGKALEFLEEAVRFAEVSGNRSVEAWALLNTSDLAFRLDDPVVALQLAGAAKSFFEETHDTWGLSILLSLEADVAHSVGEWPEARRLYEEALELTRLGNPAFAVTIEPKLAAVARAEGRLGDADAHIARGHELAERTGMPGYAKVTEPYELGQLALARGEWSAAEQYFRQFLSEIDIDTYTNQFRFDAQARLAEAVARKGDIAAAAVELRRATEDLDAWRSTLEDRQFRLSVLHARKHDWDRDLGIAYVISAIAKDGDVEVALALAEGQRSRLLLDRMARSGALSGDEASEESVAPSSLDFNAAGLAAVLPPRTAAVSFVTDLGGEVTTAFVISSDGIRAFTLPAADSLAEDISRFVALLESDTDAPALARRLGDALIAPILEAIPRGVENLVLAPDGPLHRLPFDALRLGDGRLLMERFVVTLTPSLAYAAAIWTAEERAPGVGFIAFGDPSFMTERSDDSSDARRGALDIQGATLEARLALPRLPGSRIEARAVARYARGSRLLLGSEASEAALKEASLEGYGVIHFATHALVADRSVLRSALVLAPGGGEDGFVHPDELAELSLGADLVVLSACRTAGGVLLAAEGVQGLIAPILEAGARAVVASYWPLGDLSAIPMIEDFYDRMAGGLPAAEALREAKLAAILRGDPPRVWAALALVGDGRVQPVLRTPARSGLWLLSLLVVLSVLALYGVRMRRGRAGARTSTPPGTLAVTHHR